MTYRSTSSSPPLQRTKGTTLTQGGREEEGMSSNRPELVDLRECLEAHQDHENLLYLTDSEATLQTINKWIGGGAKLRLARLPDGDVLKAIIIKLQRRVKGRLNEENERTWIT